MNDGIGKAIFATLLMFFGVVAFSALIRIAGCSFREGWDDGGRRLESRTP